MLSGGTVRVVVVRVQDGDSLIVRPYGWRSGDEFPVRLFAIDAPEWDQEYGGEAREYLWQLVDGRTDLTLEIVDEDYYGRQVGVLYYRSRNRRRSVNYMLVEQGLAYWDSSYGGEDLGLEKAERDARRKRRGVGASRGQVTPWEHRQGRRTAATPSGGCLRWALLAAALSVGIATAAAWAVLA